MNTLRAAVGSIGPYGTRRRATSSRPCSVTRSNAMTRPERASQYGSECDRFTRCAPSRSIHDGCTGATVRAYRLVVSTISAAMTQAGGFWKRTEPGWT